MLSLTIIKVLVWIGKVTTMKQLFHLHGPFSLNLARPIFITIEDLPTERREISLMQLRTTHKLSN